MNKKTRRDVCEEITNQVIGALERGVAPWRSPMDQTAVAAGIPTNAASGACYNGINVLVLWAARQMGGYTSNRWLTYKQAVDQGGHVRAGESGTLGIFYKTLDKDTDQHDETTGETVREHIPMLRSFTLFNLDQIDGADKLREQIERPHYPFTPLEAGERLLGRAGVAVSVAGARAFYRPSTDSITLPDRDRYERSSDFYATFAHELTHATGHASRCARNPYKTPLPHGAYAFEELVAELGAVFVTAHIGLPQPITDHASYIGAWLEVLRNDKRCIFKAAAQAQRACDWILARLVANEVQETAWFSR